MLSKFQLLTNREKLAIVRAFFLLKDNPEFQQILAFFDEVEKEITTNLRTLPIEQVAKEQGKAQLVFELKNLIDSATESQLKQLRDQHN